VEDKRRILIAELTAREGCEAEVRSTLADYAVHVRAEPGNEVFQCYQTEDAPQLFVVYEIYSDEAAFQAHLAAPMNKEVNQRLTAITEGGSTLKFLMPFGEKM